MENTTNEQNQKPDVYVFDEVPTPPTEAEIAEVERKALQRQKTKDFISEYGVNYQGMLDRFFDFQSMSKTHAAKFVCRDSKRYLSVQLSNGQNFSTRMRLRDLIMFDDFHFLDYFYSEMTDKNEFYLGYQFVVSEGFVKGYPFSKTENYGVLVCVVVEPITKKEVLIPKEVTFDELRNFCDDHKNDMVVMKLSGCKNDGDDYAILTYKGYFLGKQYDMSDIFITSFFKLPDYVKIGLAYTLPEFYSFIEKNRVKPTDFKLTYTIDGK